MKIPNIHSVSACVRLETKLSTGQVIDGMVTKETEKAASGFTKDQDRKCLGVV